MQFNAVTGSAAPKRSECMVLGVYEAHELTAGARAFDRQHGRRISALLRRGDFAGRLGDTLLLSSLGDGANARVLLVGLGPRKSYNRKAYRRVLQAALSALTRTGAQNAVSWLAHEPVTGLDAYYAGRFASEGAANVLYRIPDLKTGAGLRLLRCAASFSCSRTRLGHGRHNAVSPTAQPSPMA